MRRVQITLEPVIELTRGQRKNLDIEVAKVGEFFRRDALLTIGPLSETG
jgi:hypothetical protein